MIEGEGKTSPFLRLLEEYYEIVRDGKVWCFALPDRGLDYEIDLPVTVAVTAIYTYKKSRGPWKVLGIKIILS
jgi:hypothetical protein